MRQAETATQQAEYQRLIDQQTEEYNREMERIAAQAQQAAQPQYIPGAVVQTAAAPMPSVPVSVEGEGVPMWIWIAAGAAGILTVVYVVNKPKTKRSKN